MLGMCKFHCLIYVLFFYYGGVVVRTELPLLFTLRKGEHIHCKPIILSVMVGWKWEELSCWSSHIILFYFIFCTGSWSWYLRMCRGTGFGCFKDFRALYQSLQNSLARGASIGSGHTSCSGAVEGTLEMRLVEEARQCKEDIERFFASFSLSGIHQF